MVKKVTYDEMFPHLRHIEEHYGRQIFELPRKEMIAKFSSEYQKDWQVIVNFANYSKVRANQQSAHFFWAGDPHIGTAVKFLIKQGYYAKEIAPKIGLPVKRVAAHIHDDQETHKLYQSYQAKRKTIYSQKKHKHNKRIGKRILTIQKQLNLDTNNLANQLGMSKNVLSNWEQGKSNPLSHQQNKSRLLRIAQLGHMTLDELTK